jgi:hypothetical protein
MMELVLVSDDIDLATRAIDAGVARCLIDLELLGKSERQAGHGTFITHHSMSDVERMRSVLPTGALEVRIDRLNSCSPEQIDRVIDAGADIVMLPMVEATQEVHDVIDLVGGRARTCLLVETAIGLSTLPELIVIPGVDEIHIGLNDLMISSGGDHLFRPLASGMLDDPARLVRSSGFGLGIGGITVPGTIGLPVDPDRLIGELVRLDVTLAWLGRSFRQCVYDAGGDISRCIERIRAAEQRWRSQDQHRLALNHLDLVHEVDRTVRRAVRSDGVS